MATISETPQHRPAEPPATPVEVTLYCERDFSPAGVHGHALAERFAQEEHDGRVPVHLTEGLDGSPLGLTPEMNAWYTQHVGPLRNAAIAAVQHRFAQDRIRDVPCVFREYEADQIRNRTLVEKIAAVDEFRRATAEKRRDLDHALREFEVMRAEQGGRPPRMMNPWLYWLGLVAIVILEFFLNFESFLSVPWIQSPFFAFCLTTLIGLAMGGASHYHGSLLRQWEYFFGPHDKVRNHQGRRMLAIGSTLLLLAMGAVVGARYYYIIPQIVEASLLGVRPPSMVGSLSFMAAGNLIVYLVGVAWAYSTHDEIPDYPEAKRKADLLQRDYDSAFAGRVTAELNRLDQRAAAENKTLAARDTMQNASPHYEANRRLVAMIRAKDDEVVAALKDYRARLARRAPGALYLYPDHTVLTESRTTTIGAGQWAAAELSLRFHNAGGR